MNLYRQWAESVRRFHEDEDGLEALQVILIVAIAAVMLIFLRFAWNTWVSEWFREEVTDITDGGKVTRD